MKIFEGIMSKFPHTVKCYDEWEKLANNTHSLTGAQIKRICHSASISAIVKCTSTAETPFQVTFDQLEASIEASNMI